MYRVAYIHTKCGGEVDTRFFGGRRCFKCGKRWGFIGFLLDPNGIRPIRVKVPYEPARVKAPKWSRKLGADWLVEYLPAWPRWARILSTLAFVLLLGGVIWRVMQ